ncbi:hypothetical protein QBC46DRAFT_402359 [Diplogelasinospora grovesii]|uniref:Uncharacterized protein n=1 Tax=Diplogelasinospora grovesii TaxID=303347 RepID=A0AAN6MWY1_9PEZI|nr:hypothetical protein QBC46DRAFT_402359 [Diplogelasinospora grovesii]
MAAQRAIGIYTSASHMNVNPALLTKRLVGLTNAIAGYKDKSKDSRGNVFPEMHYLAARTLISLLAPTAPCFAEELWVLLHYGAKHTVMAQKDNRNKNEPHTTPPGAQDDETVETLAQLAEDRLGRRNLPR